MPTPAFGGSWTERKLSVVSRYLGTYTQALKNQPFELLYIDAFAGTGDRTEKRLENLPLLDLPELHAMTKGSVRLALEVEPPFHRYVFMERIARRASELSGLVTEYSHRRIDVINADANEAIVELCRTTSWQRSRGVVFLDPYGLQLSWNTLVVIAGTGALDVWVLIPTGIGMNRLLKNDGNIPEEWQDTLDRFLGTGDWRSEFYRTEDSIDLFGERRSRSIKEASTAKFEKFIVQRLRSIFPIALDQGVQLTNSKDQVMYLLCFASANPSPKVKGLVTRLARWASQV